MAARPENGIFPVNSPVLAGNFPVPEALGISTQAIGITNKFAGGNDGFGESEAVSL